MNTTKAGHAAVDSCGNRSLTARVRMYKLYNVYYISYNHTRALYIAGHAAVDSCGFTAVQSPQGKGCAWGWQKGEGVRGDQREGMSERAIEGASERESARARAREEGTEREREGVGARERERERARERE
jgi:hypothetical protein